MSVGKNGKRGRRIKKKRAKDTFSDLAPFESRCQLIVPEYSGSSRSKSVNMDRAVTNF